MEDLPEGKRKDALLFGEAQTRVLISTTSYQAPSLLAKLQALNLDVVDLGTVTEGNVNVDGQDWGSIKTWKDHYLTVIESVMDAQ